MLLERAEGHQQERRGVEVRDLGPGAPAQRSARRRPGRRLRPGRHRARPTRAAARGSRLRPPRGRARPGGAACGAWRRRSARGSAARVEPWGASSARARGRYGPTGGRRGRRARRGGHGRARHLDLRRLAAQRRGQGRPAQARHAALDRQHRRRHHAEPLAARLVEPAGDDHGGRRRIARARRSTSTDTRPSAWAAAEVVREEGGHRAGAPVEAVRAAQHPGGADVGDHLAERARDRRRWAPPRAGRPARPAPRRRPAPGAAPRRRSAVPR